MNIVLFGKPGAGKGTQAPKIADALGVPTLATGNVLRSAVREGTRMGKEAKAYFELAYAELSVDLWYSDNKTDELDRMKYLSKKRY